ncbi:hypothetical protein HK099_007035 [Clydaea vesicula]|uniref:Uncharacterized protein n=1 Tax=Clydaea vesicula TaxID=447962 RepID=A0AAD5Y2C5_9FUNG|nr:hypothetical protein HK099_007035 [Clydaea vesicula]KAJ3391410.1 hypothetical protein HDU92_009070 [Lobulomyces angularis]
MNSRHRKVAPTEYIGNNSVKRPHSNVNVINHEISSSNSADEGGKVNLEKKKNASRSKEQQEELQLKKNVNSKFIKKRISGANAHKEHKAHSLPRNLDTPLSVRYQTLNSNLGPAEDNAMSRPASAPETFHTKKVPNVSYQRLPTNRSQKFNKNQNHYLENIQLSHSKLGFENDNFPTPRNLPLKKSPVSISPISEIHYNANSITGDELLDILAESAESAGKVVKSGSLEEDAFPLNKLDNFSGYHKPMPAANATEAIFNHLDEDTNFLTNEVGLNFSKRSVNEILSPLMDKVTTEKAYTQFEENKEHIMPTLEGKNSKDIYDEFNGKEYTIEKKFKFESLLQKLSLYQINVLLFHLARVGDLKSLKKLLNVHNLDLNLKDDEGRTPLFYCAIGNHEKSLHFLLKNGSIISNIDSSGRTAFHWACYYGCYNSCKVLFKYLTDSSLINSEDFQGKNFLHLSIYPEKSLTLKFLLRKCKLEVNQVDEEKMTPLMWATFYGNTDNVKLLLKFKGDPFLKDIEGKTALHWSTCNKHSGCCSTLLKFNPELANIKDNLGRVPVHLAAGEGNCAIVETLIKNEITKIGIRDNLRRTPLHWAAVRGHVACTKLLCDRGSNVNKVDQFGASALHYAAERNFRDCVHVLIKKGIAVDCNDENGQTPLLWAASAGNVGVIKMLLENNAQIEVHDINGLTALHLSADAGHTSCCVFLIQKGADVNAPDLKEQTPLFRASINGRTDTALALINEGADVNVNDRDGRFPLHWAASAGHFDVVNILIGQGANPNCVDFAYTSPLHEAAFQGRASVVSYLLQCGALVNAKDEFGITPLHRAAGNNQLECCQLLIEGKAKVNALDFEDVGTPLDLCLRNINYQCIQYLQSVGALTKYEVVLYSVKTIQKFWRKIKENQIELSRSNVTKKSNLNSSSKSGLGTQNRRVNSLKELNKDFEEKILKFELEKLNFKEERLKLEKEKAEFYKEKAAFEEELLRITSEKRKLQISTMQTSNSENPNINHKNNIKLIKKQQSEVLKPLNTIPFKMPIEQQLQQEKLQSSMSSSKKLNLSLSSEPEKKEDIDVNSKKSHHQQSLVNSATSNKLPVTANSLNYSEQQSDMDSNLQAELLSDKNVDANQRAATIIQKVWRSHNSAKIKGPTEDLQNTTKSNDCDVHSNIVNENLPKQKIRHDKLDKSFKGEQLLEKSKKEKAIRQLSKLDNCESENSASTYPIIPSYSETKNSEKMQATNSSLVSLMAVDELMKVYEKA